MGGLVKLNIWMFTAQFDDGRCSSLGPHDVVDGQYDDGGRSLLVMIPTYLSIFASSGFAS